MDCQIEVTKSAQPADLAAVQGGLARHNQDYVGPVAGVVAVLLRDDTGVVAGGAVGPMFLREGCERECFLDWMWVRADLRGQRYGSRLLAAAEASAAEQGCRRMTLNTFSFQALEFYRKQGYTPLVTIPDFMVGYDKIYLRKALTPNV
ncbi:MAG: GNAT family N-acetyltransferase [Alphaproteobacteria bacterium]|nr:GNAT family N-acetyltransferase [Alphaproteobacteria bacterium]